MKTLSRILYFLVHFTSKLCILGFTSGNHREMVKDLFANISVKNITDQDGIKTYWKLLRANISTLSYLLAQAYYLVNR